MILRKLFLLPLIAGHFVLSAQVMVLNKEWKPLLDSDLSHWETFIGVPHVSADLDEYEKSEDVRYGTPLGLNNDPKNVFSTIMENNELLLKISGEIYGGLTSINEFENYHLRFMTKWGDKKWAPRLDKKKDSGLLYHCHGKHGAFWNVWMSSLECQVQEGDTGDFIALADSRASVKSTNVRDRFFQVTNTASDSLLVYGGVGNPGYCHINASNEKPGNEWNIVEILSLGDESIHVVNGKVVMVVKNSKDLSNDSVVPLTKGKLQIQSEGAECFYKNIEIKKINKFPKSFLKQI